MVVQNKPVPDPLKLLHPPRNLRIRQSRPRERVQAIYEICSFFVEFCAKHDRPTLFESIQLHSTRQRGLKQGCIAWALLFCDERGSLPMAEYFGTPRTYNYLAVLLFLSTQKQSFY